MGGKMFLERLIQGFSPEGLSYKIGESKEDIDQGFCQCY